MALRQIKAGSTSVILQVFLQDSSSSTGNGLTGLTSASSGLTCYYKRNRDAAAAAVTLAAGTLGTYSSGGFKEVDATNQRGLYDFCPPDAALAAGAQSVVFFFKGATNLADAPVLVELTQTDNQDAAAGGLSRLDAAVSAVLTTALAESYAASGAAPTAAQALYLLLARHFEAAVSGTTMTLKKVSDHATAVATLTLDDGSTPTSITRSS